MNFTPDLAPAGEHAPAWHFLFRDARLLVAADSGAIPLLADAAAAPVALSERVFVGMLDGRPAFAANLEAGFEPTGELAWQGLRGLLARADAGLAACASRAAQLALWNRDHRHCGRCGSATVPRGHERARECPGCGLVAYPRIAPAIMALVLRGRELLLARSARFPAGMFSALAGFVEAGESLEDTLAREVREEVGVEVAGLRYFGSQSWPFPNSLMVAFVCRHAGGELRPQDEEIAEAGWFDAAALPAIPPTYSIAGRLIRSVVAGLGATPPA